MTTPEQPLATPASGWRISYADVLVAAGGLIIFLFSFAPFASFDGHSLGSAWSDTLSTFVVLAGILLIGTAAVDVLWPRHKQYVGLHRHHVQLGLGIYVLVQMIGFALEDKGVASLGWGAVLMLIGALAAAAGAILNHLNMFQTSLPLPIPGQAAAPVSYPTQGGYTPPQGGYTPPPAQPSPVDPTTPAGPPAV